MIEVKLIYLEDFVIFYVIYIFYYILLYIYLNDVIYRVIVYKVLNFYFT